MEFTSFNFVSASYDRPGNVNESFQTKTYLHLKTAQSGALVSVYIKYVESLKGDCVLVLSNTLEVSQRTIIKPILERGQRISSHLLFHIFSFLLI